LQVRRAAGRGYAVMYSERMLTPRIELEERFSLQLQLAFEG